MHLVFSPGNICVELYFYRLPRLDLSLLIDDWGFLFCYLRSLQHMLDFLVQCSGGASIR